MSDTEESKSSDAIAQDVTSHQKLKASRSSSAGWLTRFLSNYESAPDVPAVLEALKLRISNQLDKLQRIHSKYIDALGDNDDEINTAEDWMDERFQATARCLTEIEQRLKKHQFEGGLAAKDLVHPDHPKVLEKSVSPDNSPRHSASISTSSSQSPSSESSSESSTSSHTLSTQPRIPEASASSTLSSDPATPDSSASTDMTVSASDMIVNQLTPVDDWIDHLVPGRETVTTGVTETDLARTLGRLEIERDLPRIELPVFDGSPIAWPPFIEQFYVQIHSRAGINDSRRMDLLQSHVKGDAKRLIQGLGFSGRNYATSLQELKFAFGHRVAVARAFVNAITSGNTLPSGDTTALRNFYVSVRDCVSTLRQMNYISEITSSDVLRRTSSRIPGDKRTKWNDFVRNICRKREPTLLDFEKFLRDCVESEFNPYAVHDRHTKRHLSTSTSVSHTNFNTAMNSVPPDSRSCVLCAGDHYVSRCPDYLGKPVDERYELVKTKHLCFNCLSQKHRIADCGSTTSCKVSGCSSKHHTTLHRRRPAGPGPDGNGIRCRVSQVNNVQAKVTKVYFQVLPVIVQGRNGRSINTFALLDSASDITLIDVDLAKDLGLKGCQENLILNTLSSTVSLPSKRVSLSVRASGKPDAHPIWIQEVWTKPGSFKCTPVCKTDIQDIPHLQDLQFTDIKPADVKMLIGANVPVAHLQISSRQGSSDAPVAVETQLGWCLLGSSTRTSTYGTSANVNFIMGNEDLGHMVEQFWKTESFGVSVNLPKPFSVEDQRATALLESETKFEDGHYTIPMLWRDPDTDMPKNRTMAESRFNSLLKRLSQDTVLQGRYKEVMNSYISNGYARKLTSQEVKLHSKKTWYLPHHGVTNPNKPGKVRVVFDAAAEYQGVSLNNQLMTGPDFMNSLFAVIQQFRMKPVALVADIAEMFHQVRVSENDSEALRFLWKHDLEKPGPPDEYKMLVHIFGAADSPCCVNFALRQAALSTDEKNEAMAKYTILRNFYVDDMLKAVDDIPSAITLAHSITDLLSRNGFKLTKWMSPAKEVLASIPQEIRAEPLLDLDLDKLPIQRALGIRWDVQLDCFVFDPVIADVTPTKRSIVSAVSSIFDPCGFLAPFTFRAKCIIQELWREDLGWDQMIPERLQQRWKNWCEEIPYLSKLHIPRFHGFSETASELHVFCDASEAGFASVAYLRMEIEPGEFRCSFLAAKSHVAPIRHVMTIPKLELQGAVMAVRLCMTFLDALPVSRCTYWTDAMTVLRYIHNESKRWKIFVANRVTEIRMHSEPQQWKHVPSKQNPADFATRGLAAEDITADGMWLTGPAFLSLPDSNWPSQPEVGPPAATDENLRKVTAFNTSQHQPLDVIDSCNLSGLVDPHRFSSWNRLLRHVAWIRRAIRNFISACARLHTVPVKDAVLSSVELSAAEVAIVRMAQQDSFKIEFKALRQGDAVEEKSPLHPLDPFFDDDLGVIRVGGRLRKAPLEAEFKYQLLLPYEHHVSELIVLHAHLKIIHSGIEHTTSTVRQKFWPIKCRQLVKKMIRKCLDCHRRSVRPVVPKMADLPIQHISGSTRPFQHTGLDYFGPILVKRARSRVKKWGCLFTCLVTRAVHIELADSLSTDDFIMVLRRFISRRGQPIELFSDNATNFRGAEREIQESLQQLDQERIHSFLEINFTKWNFIPPYSPHFGGAWERLVGSVKRTLRALLKEQCVTEAVLHTALLEVEATINSRPLTYNSSDTRDFAALTPNHFLFGGATGVAPIGKSCPGDIDSRKRWRQSQVLADHLWQRWLHEYLPNLTARQTWREERPNLKVDDLVLLMDNNCPRGQWNLGRVLEVILSSDARVRSIKVKTSHGTYVRPASKICLLEEAVEC